MRKKELIFKKLHAIDKRDLKTRKKIEVYEAVDFHSYYTAIFLLEQKSRFLRKDAKLLEELYERLKVVQDHNFKKKILLFKMPLCSKAKAQMKEDGWRLIDVSL